MRSLKYVSFSKKRAFGIELETNPNVPQSKLRDAILSVDKERSVNVSSIYGKTDGSTKVWHVKFDRTCGYHDTDGGWEVVSYKGQGYKDLINFSNVVNALAQTGVKVNDRCGFHIHADAKDLGPRQIAVLMAYWIKSEDIIANMLPSHRVNNKFCQMMRSHYRGLLASSWKYKGPGEFFENIRPYSPYGNGNRRVALNLSNYAAALDKGTSNRKTVELRLPEGTLIARDVENWIRFFVHFVTHASILPFPETLSSVSLRGALQACGLEGQDDFYVLSKGLWETKKWFLERIVTYSRRRNLVKEAVEMLNYICEPNESFKLKEESSSIKVEVS